MPFAMLLACGVFGCSSGQLPPQDAAGVAGTQPCHRYNSAQRVNARGKRHISVDGFDEASLRHAQDGRLDRSTPAAHGEVCRLCQLQRPRRRLAHRPFEQLRLSLAARSGGGSRRSSCVRRG